MPVIILSIVGGGGSVDYVTPDSVTAVPFGMLPVLELDGKLIGQSNAIARYLARQYDLVGKDEKEALQCDAMVDTLGDLKQGVKG